MKLNWMAPPDKKSLTWVTAPTVTVPKTKEKPTGTREELTHSMQRTHTLLLINLTMGSMHRVSR